MTHSPKLSTCEQIPLVYKCNECHLHLHKYIFNIIRGLMSSCFQCLCIPKWLGGVGHRKRGRNKFFFLIHYFLYLINDSLTHPVPDFCYIWIIFQHKLQMLDLCHHIYMHHFTICTGSAIKPVFWMSLSTQSLAFATWNECENSDRLKNSF